MKHLVTLYEFMPYGAPEMIESRQRHMSWALVLTSGSALALYALAGGLFSLIPGMPPKPPPTVFDVSRDFLPPPLVPIPPRASVAPPTQAAPPASPLAPAVPVPDPVAPPIDTSPPAGGSATSGGVPAVAGSGDLGTVATDGEVFPSPDTPVYVEELPTVIRSVVPDYPPIAKDAGVEGLVMVKVLVGRDGRVLDTRLVEKFQVPMLNAAALEAARKWVFTPGLASGRPVICWATIPFRFRLH